MNQENSPSLEQFLLVALIDIYRGLDVKLPADLDQQAQSTILKDVLSSAISFAEKDESRQIISNELYQCAKEGGTLEQQKELIQRQSPDVINAKTVAAAHLLKIINKEKGM
ncbi:hypothetical protein [Desulforamulus ferrireducens]|uniref:Uncharacterized protein n=1 Tax=Desulforamulus ferrireducens TaxID=1833852 RepID=A0A1S6IZ61_9FIRM|nr:hypothetical protein [Desulforamulus ferrireducens]AQS60061.1 hypothetical protein B0537_13860 [Desulforamulus ferrireducens]